MSRDRNSSTKNATPLSFGMMDTEDCGVNEAAAATASRQ